MLPRKLKKTKILTFGGKPRAFHFGSNFNFRPSIFGIQIRNMKMVFNIYGTWCQVTLEKQMMKIYDFFYLAKSSSHPV